MRWKMLRMLKSSRQNILKEMQNIRTRNSRSCFLRMSSLLTIKYVAKLGYENLVDYIGSTQTYLHY